MCMRRLLVVLALAAVQAMLLAGAAGASSASFFDGFAYFDTERWSKGDHKLGRGYLDPRNVSVSGDNLQIKLPARTLDGGEVLTNGLYGYGSYTARMKIPYAPTSITGFFLYKSPDYESEIDIEVFNDSSRKVMFTTYAGGSQTHTETMLLPFDPTVGYHEYRFDYAPGYVGFYVDGRLMKEWTDGIPQTSMHLMVNAWFPSWLGGKKPRKDAYLYVDSIGYTQQ
jgi:beta-glucanase (GH16 family)